MSYLRKSPKKKFKLGEWKVYNHYTSTYQIFTLDELKLHGATLPLKCKKAILEDRELTRDEQKDLILLTDLSMQVWGGSPQNKLPNIHIEDYYSSFFINIIKYLKKFDENRAGCWVALCKYVGFDTVNEYFKENNKQDKLTKALESLQSELEHLYPDAYKIKSEESDTL
jgi:hypothetical protein